MTHHRPITFITPVGRIEPVPYQEQAAISVADVAERRNAPVRWVRVLDGITEVPLPAPSDRVETITLPSVEPAHVGAAAPRNRALPYLLDGWMTALDADDALVPEGYLRLIDLVEGTGRLWGAAPYTGIDCDGVVVSERRDAVGETLLPTGYFLDRRLSRGDWAWHCSAMIIDSRLVAHTGGWLEGQEILRSEDTGFTSMATHCEPGVWQAEPVLLFRKHGRSVTQQPGWEARSERLDIIEWLALDARARWQAKAKDAQAA